MNKADYIKYTKQDLLLILSYVRAKKLINSHSYRSIRNSSFDNIKSFLTNINMLC